MSKHKRTAFLLLKLTVSACLIWIFYRRITLVQLTDTLASIRPAFLLPMFVVLLFNSFISSVKWHIFLAASGLNSSLRRLFSTYLAASFLNIFLPSNVGGDFYRIYDASIKTTDSARSTASVLADRISGFLAIVIFGLAATISGFGTNSSPAMILVPVAVFSMLVLGTFLIYERTLLMSLLKLIGLTRFNRLVDKLDAFFQAFQAYRKHPRLFLKVMGISFLFQFMVIVFVFLMSESLDLGIPFILFCVYVPLISLLEAIPLSVYGVGFREAGYVLFMTSVGQTREAALSMSLLYVLLTLLYSSIGGMILAIRYFIEKPSSEAA